MPPKGKGALAIMLGGGKPPAEDMEMDMDEGGMGQAEADAQAVIDAIQAGDAKGLVTAFSALKESCEAGYSDEMDA